MERGSNVEPEEEEPEAFLKSLLVNNWKETKIAYDGLDEENQERFTKYLIDKDCMNEQLAIEMELHVLSESMSKKTVKEIKELMGM